MAIYQNVNTFRTHTGEIVSGEPLQKALNKVADDLIALADAIRKEDAYASHVTEQQKEDNLLQGYYRAEKVRRGIIDNFTHWQRVNQAITGECVALLS